MFAPSIHQMGETALLVSFGGRISQAANRRVHRLSERLRDENLWGLVDLVPAYSSLLVRFEPSILSEELLRERILSTSTTSVSQTTRQHSEHIVPVQYGGEAGPDLASLADEVKLSEREVIRLHSGRDYRVYFLGFMPGFTYMGTVARKIAVPRLATPRIRVPAGSVGIASAQTGVYPFSSPGGWRLVGRTSLQLWDPSRDPPALFAPDDYVRFVESDSEPGPPAPLQQMLSSERPAFRVLEPGALTTVQDLGRPGYGSLGLCQGGAMDVQAVIRANTLLGNPPDAATLELTWTGPTLRALRTVAIALDGADFGCVVDSSPVPLCVSWLLRAGSTLRFKQSAPKSGSARAYLAVSGGFDVSKALGSCSTYLPATLGGFAGRTLQRDDVLGVGNGGRPPSEVAGRFGSAPGYGLPADEQVLRFISFSGPASANAACRTLVEKEWTVSEGSDRMGTRIFASDGLPAARGSGEIASFGVVRGAIQLSLGGNPVILGADHQTTGGYPLIGVVAEADWPQLAQLCPGSRVRFREISVGEARSERNKFKFA